jgi:ADP-L-glycero-D-manno-heptose 6-epimerase
MGACTDTTMRDEGYLIYNNTVYSKQLLSWCIERDVRFMFATSGATYGDGSRGYSDDETGLRPLNCYGYSKHLFDQWMLQSVQKPPQWVGLKFFNVYGPHEEHKRAMASFVLQSYKQIQATGRVRLFKSYRPDYEDGMQLRDFIYVKDVARVLLFFVENRDISGIVNVGTGNARSFLDLASAVFDSMNRQPLVEFCDMPAELRNKYQYFTQAEMQKLRSFGYTDPFSSLEEGVHDYVRTHLAPTGSAVAE